VGAGLLAPRPGPAAASALLSSPVTLLARLQRAGVLGWAAGLALLGATFGSLTDAVVDMVAGNSLLAEAFAVRGSDITDSFTAVTAQYAGLCTAGFAVASVLRLRAEESTGRAELLLASPVDRRRLLGAGLTVTAGASVLLLAVAGLAAGGCAAVVTGDPAELGRQLGAVLVQLPAVLVVAGVAALLFGAAPRLAGLSWAVVCWALLAGLFGPLLGLPRWSVRLSPFGWLPAVPAEPLDAVPLAALTAVAAGLAVLALAGFRRRDLGG
jgi:ABC-2 type transport system permease protein